MAKTKSNWNVKSRAVLIGLIAQSITDNGPMKSPAIRAALKSGYGVDVLPEHVSSALTAGSKLQEFGINREGCFVLRCNI